jgi:tetratricopeptide (TPR) repeat protein
MSFSPRFVPFVPGLALFAFGAFGASAAPLASTSAPPATVGQDGPRRSLQDLLAEERAKASAAREAARPQVESLLAKLRSAAGQAASQKVESKDAAQLRAQLVDLGAVITPLLLPVINPPDKSQTYDHVLAREVTKVLKSLPLTVILDDLCQIALTGNNSGRAAALDLIGYAEQRDKVIPVLVAAYTADELHRVSALRSLCLLGGPEADVILETLLDGADAVGEAKQEPVALLSDALSTMAEQSRAGRPLSANQLGFLKRLIHSNAIENLVESALVLTAAAPPGSLSESETLAFADLASKGTLKRELRLLILDQLPLVGLPFSKSLEDKLTNMIDGTSPLLAEASLICLAKYGDKRAEQKLLKPYRDKVNDNRNDPGALEARGTILMKIGEYHDATLDFKKAIKIIENDKDRSPFMANAAYTNLARTYCLMDEVKDAAKALKDSSLSTIELRNLASDPDFAPLLADTKLNDVFRL